MNIFIIFICNILRLIREKCVNGVRVREYVRRSNQTSIDCSYPLKIVHLLIEYIQRD